MERKAEWNIPFGIKGGIKSNEDNVIILPSGEKVDKFKGEISVNSGVKITEELGVLWIPYAFHLELSLNNSSNNRYKNL